MTKKRATAGAVLIAAGLITNGADNPAIRILSPISCGVFGGCLAIGGGMIRRGRNDKASKQYEVEQHDERNIAICGKAAYIAFFLILILELAFSAYIFHILNDMTTGFIGYGIGVISLLTYAVLYAILQKKM